MKGERMKKRVRFAILVVFSGLFSWSLFAQSFQNPADKDNDFTPVATEIETTQREFTPFEIRFPSFKAVSATLGFNTGNGFEQYHFLGQAMFILDHGSFSAYSGIQGGKGSFDFVAAGMYWPLRLAKFRLGVGAVYNLNFYSDISMTNNILPGIYIDWRPSDLFYFGFSFKYMLKLRTIYAIADKIPALVNNTVAFGFLFQFNLPHGFGVYLEAASYERYRYMIIGVPSFTAGLTYRMNPSWTFGFEAVVRFIDFFTLSATYDDSEFRLSARYTL